MAFGRFSPEVGKILTPSRVGNEHKAINKSENSFSGRRGRFFGPLLTLATPVFWAGVVFMTKPNKEQKKKNAKDFQRERGGTSKQKKGKREDWFEKKKKQGYKKIKG